MENVSAIPDRLERATYRYGGEFSQWHAVWGSHSRQRAALNSKRYLGDINLMLMQTRPRSLEEWEGIYIGRIGMRRLAAHAALFSKRTNGKLLPADALKVILWHAIDETWWGWQCKLQALQQLNQQAAEAASSEAVEALIGAAEDAAGEELSDGEKRLLQAAEVAATGHRVKPFRLATVYEFTRWGLSLIEEQAGQLVAGYWVRPQSFLALGHNQETKELELRQVLNFLRYQHEAGHPSSARYVSYNWESERDMLTHLTVVPFRAVLAEVMDRHQLPADLPDAQETKRQPGAGVSLHAVSLEQMKEREREAQYQLDRLEANRQKQLESGNRDSPTLF